jgi:hypothetical protein
MSIRGLCYSLGGCAVAALFAGCGGAQSLSRVPAAAKNYAAQRSSRGDLIFVSADRNASGYYIFAWSYPRGRFAMKIGGASGIGMCSDKAGDVWLAENAGRQLVEFDHSGSIIKTLPDENNDHAPWGCSVDPSTGNVAAINIDDGKLVVYPNGSGSGTAYQTSLGAGYSCAYDAHGNLFGYGTNRQYKGQLVELRAGSSTIGDISVRQTLPGNGWIQWDGNHLAMTAERQNDYTATIDRLRVTGSNAKVVGATVLASPRRLPQFGASQFWIQGRTVAESIGYDGKEIGLWNYPAGGKPKRVIVGSGGSHAYYINGLSISRAAR